MTIAKQKTNTGAVPRSESYERHLLLKRDYAITALRNAKYSMEAIDQELLEYMTENNCALAISEDERLYVGTTKVTKCVDDQATLMAILDAGGGNMELLTSGEGGMLVSQPYKYGSVRTLIGEHMFGQCFTVEIRADLKTGKQLKSVKVFDRRFARKPKS